MSRTRIFLQNFSVTHQVKQIAKVHDYPDAMLPALLWCVGMAAMWST